MYITVSLFPIIIYITLLYSFRKDAIFVIIVTCDYSEQIYAPSNSSYGVLSIVENYINKKKQVNFY